MRKIKTCALLMLVVTVFMILSCLLIPGRIVNADSPTIGEIVTDETELTVGNAYRQRIERTSHWFSFKPNKSGLYRVNADPEFGIFKRPCIMVYDSNMELIALGSRLGNLTDVAFRAQKGQIYHIKLGIKDEYIGLIYRIEITETDLAFCVEHDGERFYCDPRHYNAYVFYSNPGDQFKLVFESNEDIVVDWAIREGESEQRRKLDNHSASLTVSCPATDYSIYMQVYVDGQEKGHGGTLIIANYSAITINGKSFNYETTMLPLHDRYTYKAVAEGYQNLDSIITLYAGDESTSIRDVDSIDLPDVASPVYISYSVNRDYTQRAVSETFLFVDDPTKKIRATEGESIHVEFGSSETGGAADERLIEFTPEVSGTYTFSSFNRVSGSAEVVLFDEDYRMIGRDMPLFESELRADYMRFSYKYDGIIFGNEIITNDGYRYHCDCSLTAQLTAGKTYYYALPVYRNAEMNNYDVKITLDNITRPVSSPTTAPASRATATATPTPRTGSSSAVTSQPTAAPSVLPESSRPGIADFVERLYTVALDRPSDPYGKADWINRVMIQGYTGADVAKGFLFSPEFIEKNMSNEQFVEVLYKTFFDRVSDPAGKADWLNRMANGWTKQDVIIGFVDSIEWANLCLTYGIPSGGLAVPTIRVQPSDGVLAFCARLYTTCLGRDYDQYGLNYWAERLANMEISGSAAAFGFFFSREFIDQNLSDDEYVERLYTTFMGRQPDPDGRAYWLNRLATGASREDVFHGFADSTEFGLICSSFGILQ